MKHVQSCLSARKDRESGSHHCEGLVKLVQTCVCAGNTCKSRFHRRGAVKLLLACLCTGKT